MKKIILLITLFLISLIKAEAVSASYLVVSDSAQLKICSNKTDPRIGKLEVFLKEKGSPLSDYSDFLINQADKYQLDWRLIPAITGVESNFGKRIPKNSFNAYGWANGTFYFESWEDSILTVSKTLKEKYIDRGARTTFQIARIYAPPSKTWAYKVENYMDQIDPYPIDYSL